MQNKFFVLLSLSLFAIKGSAQSFEGEIIYHNVFKSNIPNLNAEQLSLLIGTEQQYFIRGGNYKSLINSQAINMQEYDPATNRIYTRTTKSDTLYWTDASINNDSLISYEIRKNAATILNYPCDAIIMKVRSGTMTLYYNRALLLEAAYIGTAALLPLIALLTVSFTKLWSGRLAWRTWNMANYQYVLTRSELTGTAIRNTVVLAIVAATIGIVLAVPQGMYSTRGNSRRRTLVENILSWPSGIPGIIVGLGFLILASHTPLLGSFSIILIAWIARCSEYSTRTVTAVLLAINPELEESARASGANWSQMMRHIVMPMLRWPLAVSWLMLFAVFMRELGATILLYARGTETISVAMVVLSDRGAGYVAALGVVQLMILLLAFLLVQFSRAPLTQRPAGVPPA